jgi:hypothetical protein
MAAVEKTSRADGRKPLLVYLHPKLIRALKRKALDDDTHVYLMIEDILLKQEEFKHSTD